MVQVIQIALLFFFVQSHLAGAYVFARDTYTGEPVRQRVSAESPRVYFYVSGNVPEFKSKDKFLDGKYASLDDKEFFNALVQESLQRWTDVEDAYIELALAAEVGPGANQDDKINNISFSSGSWSDAGSALVVPGDSEEDARYIVDCDISLDSDTNPETLAFTVLHEIGHCMGLWHPHYSTKSVMSYATISKKFELTLDDKAGLTVLYPVQYEKRKHMIPLCGNIAAPGSNSNPSALVLCLLALPMLIILQRREKYRRNFIDSRPQISRGSNE